MDKKSKSKVDGESKDVAGSTRLDTQSTDEASRQLTSAMSDNSPNLQSPIIFQPTKALGEIDETTANLQIILAFASKLGAKVFWKRFALGDGQEVFALCFPTNSWTTNALGELTPKR